MYNDTIFGGLSWSKDNLKVTFVGETPAVSSFKNPWDKKVEKSDINENDHW
jgi:hypothetical protein